VTNRQAASAPRIAIVGAGPVGLALALHASRWLPRAQLTVFDSREAARDVAGDPRTLALSLGSVRFLEQLGAWPAAQAEPILQVHVSQQTPAWPGRAAAQPQVRLAAQELGVPMLGAVLSYGALLAPLQRAWFDAVDAAPGRLTARFGNAVTSLVPRPGGIELDAGGAEVFDLAVVAEGGVFAEQARKAIVSDYGQTAWVGQVMLDGATPGMAFERFTAAGPAALLPLGPGQPGTDGRQRAALVWCVTSADDPVRDLGEAQRRAVLDSLFPPEAGRVVAVSPLKSFALGLNAERTLAAGRMVRIGNAAQTLHPVAGQGLNLGLRDAHQLVAALRAEADPGAALRSVDWSRAPDRWSTIAATDFLARSFTWKLPGLALLRGLALAALEATPPLKAVLARQMMFGLR
jgi:2-octaprenyl-6-methoxyphenol hydroxylase